ncbi:MAG: acyl-CoA thioesterase [Candidatus Marinimicrobia bacterium]|nr:acyl-CoA thioesterase [Candidatus Neomarinimicrobiota bacterium]MCF7828176.1 acyl-CoA thioesterase [Candidatus Neomarinimicrobiota bacterium]MCF7879649.1 acyl-CoA thioesterase [Candidatus Neomarinimicrobiota bacterium]
MFSHTSHIRVLYGHVDKMDFVYYGRYFEYFEHSRNELLRALDLPYTKIEEKQIRLPVIEAHANYRSAARFDDLINIKATVAEMPRARIRIEYEITNEAQELLITGHTVHSFLNSRGKPTRVPDVLKQKLLPHFEESNG